jgi:hypothetical protein
MENGIRDPKNMPLSEFSSLAGHQSRFFVSLGAVIVMASRQHWKIYLTKLGKPQRPCRSKIARPPSKLSLFLRLRSPEGLDKMSSLAHFFSQSRPVYLEA